jgi:hypothetical protein
MLQHATRSRAVCKEFCAVFLGRDGKADSILRHGDGAIADQSVGIVVPIQTKRQTCHSFRQNADAGIYLCGTTEEKAVGTAGQGVLGLVAGMENTLKDIQMESPPKNGYEKKDKDGSSGNIYSILC